MTDREGITTMTESPSSKRERPTTVPGLAIEPSIEMLSHALSERLTAMVRYFGAARAHYAKGEVTAAQEIFARYREQSDRANLIAEALRCRIDDQQH